MKERLGNQELADLQASTLEVGGNCQFIDILST
jgi:hypothetical protein